MTPWLFRCAWAGIVLSIIVAIQNSNAGLPIALVYKGPGSCPEDCSLASAHVAELAGFEVRYVGPQEINPNIFKDAKVYIQPGGVSNIVGDNMISSMKTALKNFIASGGGYVGFCAGGFFASLPHDGYKYLGIIAADSDLAKIRPNTSQQWVTWKDGTKRSVYFEGGPYFIVPQNSNLTITSRYQDGRVAGVEGAFGKGRVSVVGHHPEAPEWWRTDSKLVDPDGIEGDWQMAVQMIRWAAGLEP